MLVIPRKSTSSKEDTMHWQILYKMAFKKCSTFHILVSVIIMLLAPRNMIIY